MHSAAVGVTGYDMVGFESQVETVENRVEGIFEVLLADAFLLLVVLLVVVGAGG